MTWNEEAFDHLVYDEQQKDLVLSFVQSHGSSNQQQLDDVVMGKGIYFLSVSTKYAFLLLTTSARARTGYPS